MTKLNQIQSAILSLDPGAYQKLMEDYVIRKFSLSSYVKMSLGSQAGTNKTTKGTPDFYALGEDGKFICVAYGSVAKNAFSKVKEDILGCLDFDKTGVQEEDISKIICCHTFTNFTPGQTKELYSCFSNVVLVGLDDTARDLETHYPSIAKEHLSIEIDTHQIFDKQDFLNHTSQNAYSTSLDMPLLCREAEMENLNEQLHQHSIVLLCGKSGIGKTRLALEVVGRFRQQEAYTLKIVRSNGESIYNDIKATFSDDQNYVILIDDADQLAHLHHLLYLCVDTSRKYKTKILITVRDYAREKVLRTVRELAIPSEVSLQMLSDENIAIILRDNLNITNEKLIEHIQKIAKGNVRVAIMAGMCAIDGKLDQVQNVFDIFHDYYAPIVNTLSRKELVVGSLIAFFDAFPLNGHHLSFDVALKFEITKEQFCSICHDLHKNEVVDIYDTKAVKFNNQNLRDYLLYAVFIKEKWMGLSEMILATFPQYKNRVVFVCSTLIQLFYSTENAAYLTREIHVAWNEIKNSDEETILAFIKAFHAVLQNDTLVYIKGAVDQTPKYEVELADFDFEKAKNHRCIESDLISILLAFKDSDQFINAIDCALYYFEQTTQHPMDLYFLFGEAWGISRLSYEDEYSKEILLITTLLARYNNSQTTVSAYALLFAACYALKIEFSSHESNGDKSCTLYQFTITPCEAIYKLRSLAFQALGALFQNPLTKNRIIPALLQYDRYATGESLGLLLVHDMEMLSENFQGILDVNCFEVCELLEHFEEAANRRKVPYSANLPACGENSVYKMYRILKHNYFYEKGDFEEAELRKRKDIEELARKTEPEIFTQLWIALQTKQSTNDSRDNWSIQSGIEILFNILANIDSEKFMTCYAGYIAHQAPCWQSGPQMIDDLVCVLGIQKAILYIRKGTSFVFQRQWLSSLYRHLDLEDIDSQVCCEILSFISQDGLAKICIVDFNVVANINQVFDGFFRQYIEALYHACEKESYYLHEFLFRARLKDDNQTEKLMAFFGEDLDLLCKIYLRAIKFDDMFDYQGELFDLLIAENPSFFVSYIHLLRDSHYHGDLPNMLKNIWKRDDYHQWITLAVETLQEIGRTSYSLYTLEQHFLEPQKQTSKVGLRQEVWVRWYISTYCADSNRMKYLFSIISNFEDNTRIEYVHHFCKCNSDFEAFQNIEFERSHWSWSGSEVPMVESRISFLEKLKNGLDGFQFIDHKAYIDARIRQQCRYKDDVLLQEFLDAR